MKSFTTIISKKIPEALKVLALPTYATVKEAAIVLKMTFGPELLEYFTNYGAISFGSVEFNGLTETKKNNSSIVRNTVFLRDAFPNKLEKMVLLEDRGDGEYILCNENDHILRFTPELSLNVIDTGLDFIAYTLQRYLEMQ